MSEPRRSVGFTDPPLPPMLRDSSEPVDVFDLDSDSDDEENGGVVPAAGAGEEGGAEIEVKVESSDESSESEASSEEQSSKEASDDEDTLCRSVDETKEVTDVVCGKAMDLFFRKYEETKLCCDDMAGKDGFESDLCEPEAKKPKITHFDLELSGNVIIPDGAEPLDINYDESLKMLMGTEKRVEEADYIMVPIDTMKIELENKEPSDLEAAEKMTDEILELKLNETDFTTYQVGEQNENFSIAGIKTEDGYQGGGPMDHFSIADFKAEEVYQSEVPMEDFSIEGVKTEEGNQDEGSMENFSIAGNKSDEGYQGKVPMEDFSIAGMKTEEGNQDEGSMEHFPIASESDIASSGIESEEVNQSEVPMEDFSIASNKSEEGNQSEAPIEDFSIASNKSEEGYQSEVPMKDFLIADVKTEEGNQDEGSMEHFPIAGIESEEGNLSEVAMEDFSIASNKSEEGNQSEATVEDFLIASNKSEEGNQSEVPMKDFSIAGVKTEEGNQDEGSMEHFPIAGIKSEEGSQSEVSKENFPIADIKSKDSSKGEGSKEHFSIAGIKIEGSNQGEGSKEHFSIADLKTEEVNQGERSKEHFSIADIKTEKDNQGEGPKENFSIPEIKTGQSNKETALVPANLRGKVNNNWLQDKCRELARDTGIKNRDTFSKWLEIGIILRTVKPMDRPGVRQGRIALIGSPEMKAAKTIMPYLEKELGLKDNIFWVDPSNLENVLQEFQQLKGKSPWKYFMYMMDCDKGFDEVTLVRDVKLIRKYCLFEKEIKNDRFDVFYCRSIRINRRDYPPIHFIAKLSQVLGFENRPLFYDVNECVKMQCEYVKCRFLDFATGTYVL